MTQLTLRLQADLAETTRLHTSLEAFAAEHSLSQEGLFKLNLVLDELVTNAISYGFNGIARPQIHLQITLDQDYAHVCLRDNGHAFDPFNEAPEPDLDASLEHRRIGGLGIHFVRSMMDTCHYQRDGDWNVITMGLPLSSSDD
jgi:anti-sigma regulatory factor (Ser/Thr protein kinase)